MAKSNIRAKRGVALVSVLVFLALALPAMVIILAFVRGEAQFPVREWEMREAEEMASAGHAEAQTLLLGPWVAMLTAGKAPRNRFPFDLDDDGWEDFDGDGRFDEEGTLFPFMGLDHLASPWMAYPVLREPDSNLVVGRPGGSLPVIPTYGDANRDGVIDYIQGVAEVYNPKNGCALGTMNNPSSEPCLNMPFLPLGSQRMAYPSALGGAALEGGDYLWDGALYSAQRQYSVERLVDSPFVSDWHGAFHIEGDGSTDIGWNNDAFLGRPSPNPYSDRIKGLSVGDGNNNGVLDACEPNLDQIVSRDLLLGTEGLSFAPTLQEPYERESDSALGGMPDTYGLIDPDTCVHWMREQGVERTGGYGVVISDEGARFPLYGFVHNPDDPFFTNPAVLENWAGTNGSPTVAPESTFWLNAHTSGSITSMQDMHYAQRSALALLAPGVGPAKSAALLSYIWAHGVGDTSSDLQTPAHSPDEFRSDFEGDGRIDEIPAVWPSRLVEILDVDLLKLRDGGQAGGLEISNEDWKPLEAWISLWSARGEGRTTGLLVPTDTTHPLRPTLPLWAWPQITDPILRCIETTNGTTLSSVFLNQFPLWRTDAPDCLGLFLKLDLWQTPAEWPTGVDTGGGAGDEPVSDLLLSDVDVGSWASECDILTPNSGSELDDLESWVLGLDDRRVWPEEFWLFVRCFWDTTLVGSLEERREDVQTVVEVLFDDGVVGTALYPDIMGDDFPLVLSRKVVGHWTGWQYLYRYLDDSGDCRDLAPTQSLADSVEGLVQSQLAERHARYHGPGDLLFPVGDTDVQTLSGGYVDLRGPYWDPGNVSVATDPSCRSNAVRADWPDLVGDIDLYAPGFDSGSCTIGVDPTDDCRTISLSLVSLGIQPALVVPDRLPNVDASPPYSGFRWDRVTSTSASDPLGINDANNGQNDSILDRDDTLLLHFLGLVAFFDSPYATYFDDPDLHEPCRFDPGKPPHFLATDGVGLTFAPYDTNPWNGVVTGLGDTEFLGLVGAGGGGGFAGGWFEADGRNESGSDCDTLPVAGNDPSLWRPLRFRGRVNLNTATFPVLKATLAKSCHPTAGDINQNGTLGGECRHTGLERAARSVLRYREWFHLVPYTSVDDLVQGTLWGWTGVDSHVAGSFLEQYYWDSGLFDLARGNHAFLPTPQDGVADFRLTFGAGGGILQPPFRTVTQLMDVGYEYSGTSGGDDPRDLLWSGGNDRVLAAQFVAAEDDLGAVAVFARIDQDLGVGSEGYRIEAMGHFGGGAAARFSLFALADSGPGSFAPVVMEEEVSRGIDDLVGLFYGSYYR
ncbi:hypothetical protein H8D30_06725 [bacterium]|nr:hypothetical protein [bacterium]